MTESSPKSSQDSAPFGAYSPSGWVLALLGRTRTMPRTWLGLRIAYALRTLAVLLLKGRPMDVEVLGARMRLYPYNNVCEKRLAFTPQLFDPEERDFLQSHLREGFTFLDIGSNVGGYALFVAPHVGQGGRVLAVEPQPDIFERLIFNIRQNPSGTVKALACAIADKTGDVTLFIDTRNNGESSVKFVGMGQAPSYRVPAKTLMDLVRDEGFKTVDAIKLDVGGAEDLILEPFLTEAPDSLLPSLFLIEDARARWQADVISLLTGRGYALVKQTKVNLIYQRRAH